MEAEKLSKVTLEEYSKIERTSEQRYEYHNGIIRAMAGGSFNHGLIIGNIFSEIHSRLTSKNDPCYPLNNDIKLHIEAQNKFLYPDVMVVCNDLNMSSLNPEAVTNPLLIIEVLSDSTESYDRGDKFYFYRQIPKLKEYVLIAQNRKMIESYTREIDLWNISRTSISDEVLKLASIDIEIPLKSIYRKVVFPN